MLGLGRIKNVAHDAVAVVGLQRGLLHPTSQAARVLVLTVTETAPELPPLRVTVIVAVPPISLAL